METVIWKRSERVGDIGMEVEQCEQGKRKKDREAEGPRERQKAGKGERYND